MKSNKIIVYQIFTRLFGNATETCKENGSLEENGCGKMSFFDASVLRRIKKLGVTHVWYTGIIRHATCTDYSSHGIPRQHPAVVKGKAGSPYAITDYYDIDPDLADDVDNRMAEFDALVERTHKSGMKVIIDFVPNHVARQYKSVVKPAGINDLGEKDNTEMGFSPQNNFYYCTNATFEPYLNLLHGEALPYYEFPAKATGNDHFDNRPGQNDWYETVKLNYGVDYCDAGGRSYHFTPTPDTWNKMFDILLFWAGKGIDAFRCDMAEMVPVEFWRWAISKVKAAYPEILFIGEVYNPSLYRSFVDAGFSYLYDKVGMYDCLFSVIRGDCPASAITYQWQAVDDIRGKMLYFLENHDELRIASDFFAGKASKGIPATIVSALMYKNPFMLYAGQEFGEQGMDKEGFSGRDGRTTIFDYWTVRSLYHGYVNRRQMTCEEKTLEKEYLRILSVASNEKAISDGEFFDLMYVNGNSDCFNSHRQYAFLRKYRNEVLLIVVNFSDVIAYCGVFIPKHAFDYLQIPEKNVVANDLLTDDEMTISLKADTMVMITLPANGGRVYKFKV